MSPRFIRTVDEERLWRHILSGCIGTNDVDAATNQVELRSSPYWLVPIHELQVRECFVQTIDASGSGLNRQTAFEHLVEIMSQPEDAFSRRFLLRNFDYWNRTDSIGSLDELAAAGRNASWPEGGDSMHRNQLLNAPSEGRSIDRTSRYNLVAWYRRLRSMLDTCKNVIAEFRATADT